MNKRRDRNTETPIYGHKLINTKYQMDIYIQAVRC